jgi:hypothetical protein
VRATDEIGALADVRRALEENPDAAALRKRTQDVTVLFLDIASSGSSHACPSSKLRDRGAGADHDDPLHRGGSRRPLMKCHAPGCGAPVSSVDRPV